MRRPHGFTLIELIIVIVLSSILAVVAVQFISRTTQGAIDSAGRQQLAATAYVIHEQVSRAVRQSLPGSIRTTADGRCLEYIPLLTGSVYQSLDTSVALSSLTVLPVSASTDITGYLAIYPLPGGDPYRRNNPGPLAAQPVTLPAGTAPVTITLSPPHRFAASSPQRRFYITDTPETLCQDGQWLYRYRGYGWVAEVNNLQAALPASAAGGREVLAAPLQAGSLEWRFQPPTLQRNGLLTYRLTLERPGTAERLDVAQEVQVRNVP